MGSSGIKGLKRFVKLCVKRLGQMGRQNSINDMRADVVYHNKCSVNVPTGKQIVLGKRDKTFEICLFLNVFLRENKKGFGFGFWVLTTFGIFGMGKVRAIEVFIKMIIFEN